jgi:phage I-like protein
VELVPANPVGIDGRAWVNDQPEALVDVLSRRKFPLVLDWEHSTELKGAKGEEAPAAGWLREFEARNGAVWGRVEWTPRGQASVANREYRGISPVLLFDGGTRRVVSLSSVGLTNKPNFPIAINHQQETGPMANALPERMTQALALPASATEDEALAAIDKIKGDVATARNRADQPPDLAHWVPKAELEAAINRAKTAEQAVQDREAKEFEAARDQALQAVPPARRDALKALCRSKEDLPNIEAIAKTYAGITSETGAKTSPPGALDAALNHEEAAVCKAMGITAEQFIKARKAEQEESE